MSKRFRRIVMCLLLLVFCVSAGIVLSTLYRYEKNDRLYSQASEEYTRRPSQDASSEGEAEGGTGNETGRRDTEKAPVAVDFEKLREVNGDVVGWIYCEGTVIDYPVMQGEDNDYYLSHSYDGKESSSGSIFVDAKNGKGFSDENTIIYGHHMKNKSMFATLSYWADQEYYREHPVMWLLTPEQDYQIVLFSGYTTHAASDTYTIFNGYGKGLEEYLQRCVEQSDFTADAAPSGQEKYVVLSTCAYEFDNARYVLHGILVPVNRAEEAAVPEA